ncbi:hypothetical protein CCY99_05755 [Helicobacter sp. 16-1353]|uniref:peptidylprolyl isomerase n=1 Tax=Helicobacter sp. 16-1353 TaxID=2004996 RepID=UPI000DCF338B|nr:peptidylprolyl isomerase [Helicobacter sp. 16-1353]RAX53884.1 hypothetical protein CCY99_05755 [Helicobacter sp. 16-1353]
MKIFILLITCIFALKAQIIDGVAIKVDGNIITLYEIQEAQKQLGLSKQESIDRIIQEKLKENEIKRLNIKVDDKRLDDEINNIAMNNKITREDLINTLQSQGISFDDYKKELRKHLINRELMQKILQTNSNLTNENDLRQYYDVNKDEFTLPNIIKVTSYVSNSDVELQQFLSNPLILNPNIEVKDEEINIKSLPPQIVSIFLDTPEKKFTPVLNSGNTLIVFFIKEKLGKELIPFDDIKPNVMQKYAEAKENEILNEYFSKIKANTKIEIIRE